MATKKKAPAKKAKPAPKPKLKAPQYPKKDAAPKPVPVDATDQPKVEAAPIFEATNDTLPPKEYKRYSTRLGVRLIPDLKGEWVRFEDL